MAKFLVYQNGRQVASTISLQMLQSEEEVGIFESLRTYGDHIFREAEHLARFQESVQSVGYPYSVSITDLKKELHAALKAYQLFLKGCHPREGGDPGHGSPTKHFGNDNKNQDLFLRLTLWKNQIFVLVGERKHPTHIYEHGVVLQTSPVCRTHTNAQSAQVKTSAYHNAFMASLEIKAADTYEWVFLDHRGYVTEVRIGNLFIVKRDKLFTPPEDGILNGVTRGVVIECALRNRLKFEETLLTRHDVYTADEAFLTNTSWEILPVAKLDGRTTGEKIPGPITRQLQKTFKQIIQEESKR